MKKVKLGKKTLMRLSFIAALILGFFIITIPNSKAATYGELREKFPNGKYWNHWVNATHNYYNGYEDSGTCNNPDGWTDRPCSHHNGVNAPIGDVDCNSFDGAQECMGFARKLFHDYYGSDARNHSIGAANKTWLKKGDILTYSGRAASNHTVWVIGKDGNGYYIADCNWGNTCQIRWDAYLPYSDIYSVINVASAPSELDTNIAPKDTEAPVIEDIKLRVDTMQKDKVMLKAKVRDNTGVTKVRFPTWTVENGQDDIKWLDGTYNYDGDGYWCCCISASDFNNKLGMYSTHVYGYDAAGNYSSSAFDDYVLGSYPQDIGSSFKARIIPTHGTKVALADTGSKLTLKNRNDYDDSQIWLFTRIDNKYRIKNYKTGKYIDNSGGGNQDGNPIVTYEGNNSDNQKWYITNYNGGYRFVQGQPNQEKGLDIYGANFNENALINLYKVDRLNNEAQTFNISKVYNLSEPSISYQTHVQGIGWQGAVKDGQTSGTTGQSKRLEAIKINLNNSRYLGSVQYKTHIQGIGWQSIKSNGQLSGTTGQGKRMEAIQIKLTGDIANYYDIYYRCHAQHFGWLDWAKNGASAGTAGYGYRLEGIQIKLVRKGQAAPGKTTNCFKVAPEPEVRYQTHVQGIGWQGFVKNGQTSGTTGQGKRLEAIKISVANSRFSGNIEYSAHVQGIGWQGFVKNGALSGTTGKYKRLEAIKIRLTGDLAKNYDVYYRVHSQHFGWQGWAKNGQEAGTAGYGYRLEGIQIKLVRKGQPAPGSDKNRFFVKK